MNPGLLWLLRKRPRRVARQALGRVRGVKGVLLTVLVAGMVAMMVVPQLFLPAEDAAVSGPRLRALVPLAALAMTLTIVVVAGRGKGAVYFRPEEITRLFPAPIPRRQLLAYHIATRVQVQALSALWAALFVRRYVPTALGTVLGAFAAFAMLQLLAQAAMLLGARSRGAWIAVRAVAVAAVAAAVVPAATEHSHLLQTDGVEGYLRAVAGSPAVRAVAAPFLPAAETLAAPTSLLALAWSGVALAALAVVVLFLLWLDAAFEEAAINASGDIQRRLKRMRSAGVMAGAGPGNKGVRVPPFPWLRGVGPIAWRQSLAIVRNPRTLYGLALLLVGPPAVVLAMAWFSKDFDGGGAARGLFALPATMGLLGTQYMSFDFRRDVDRLPALKALPLSAMSVAAGQIAPASLLTALFVGVSTSLLLAVADLMPLWTTPFVVAATCPLTWASVALDNLMFFAFPKRFEPDDTASVGFAGAAMVMYLGKFVGLGAVVLVAALAGAAVGVPTGSLVAGVSTGILTVALADVVLTWLVGRAYNSHDPSRDTPT